MKKQNKESSPFFSVAVSTFGQVPSQLYKKISLTCFMMQFCPTPNYQNVLDAIRIKGHRRIFLSF